jgi:hypothetical protein
MNRVATAWMIGLALLVFESPRARASCAEDLTRIQLAIPKAAGDARSRAEALVSEAERRAKANDSAGCELATKQALDLLQLPALASLQLSTPMTALPTAPQKPAAPAMGNRTGAAGTSGSSQTPSPAQTPPPNRAPATAPGEGASK